ncbi:hypothetical protein [Psychromonas sp. SP041]|uniref:hypothetical protein n=1 Tax=Psychromonas sp. SP041 TaxID=1365007 RepID=UPI00040E6F0D|nr:hypothetical protein [Psychromonas sp. SP041]
MFGVILIGLIMLIVLSAGSYSVMMLMSSTNNLISAQTEIQNQNKIEVSLNHALRPYGDSRVLVAPVDLTSTVEYEDESYLTIPSALGFSSLNSWKMPYIYCPVSGDSEEISSASSSEDVSYGENSYSVVTFDDNVDDGLDYVLESNLSLAEDLSDKHTLAIVISPRFSTDIPSCSDVYLKDNGKYRFNEVDGKNYSGIITVISRDESVNFMGISNFVLDLSDFDSDASFDALTSSWESMKPLRYLVDLDDGNTRSITESLTFENNTPSLDKTIVIENSGSATSSITSSDEVTLTFKNMVVDLSNVSFSSEISLVFEGSKITFDDVDISGKVSFINSKLNVVSSSSISGTSSSGILTVQNSEINQDSSSFTVSNSASYEAVVLTNSNWFVSNGDLSISSASGDGDDVFDLREGSSLVLSDGASLAFSGTSGKADSFLSVDGSSSFSLDDSKVSASGSSDAFIDLKGTMSGSDSTVVTYGSLSYGVYVNSGILKLFSVSWSKSSSVQVGLYLKNGAVLTLQDSQLGTSSSGFVVGVKDVSASSVFGTDSNIYATTCLSGYLFDELSSSSESTPEEDSTQESANRSEWECD